MDPSQVSSTHTVATLRGGVVVPREMIQAMRDIERQFVLGAPSIALGCACICLPGVDEQFAGGGFRVTGNGVVADGHHIGDFMDPENALLDVAYPIVVGQLKCDLRCQLRIQVLCLLYQEQG